MSVGMSWGPRRVPAEPGPRAAQNRWPIFGDEFGPNCETLRTCELPVAHRHRPEQVRAVPAVIIGHGGTAQACSGLFTAPKKPARSLENSNLLPDKLPETSVSPCRQKLA